MQLLKVFSYCNKIVQLTMLNKIQRSERNNMEIKY